MRYMLKEALKIYIKSILKIFNCINRRFILVPNVVFFFLSLSVYHLVLNSFISEDCARAKKRKRE